VASSGDRLDVLYLTHNYPRHSGDFAGRFVARLAQLVAARGLRVGVLAPHHAGASEEEISEGIPVWRFRYGSDESEQIAYRGDFRGMSLTGPRGVWAHARFTRAFRRAASTLIARTDPRLLHAHWWIPGGWVARTCAGRIPYLVTTHGTDVRLLASRRWLRPLAGKVFASASRVTTVSTWLGGVLRSHVGIPQSKLGVAPMPPDDETFAPSDAPAHDQDSPVILAVTRFTPQKRNDVLLEALCLLRGRGQRFHCRVAGEGGGLEEQFKAQVVDRGLSDSIEMLGALPASRLADEYRGADVTVLCSVDEGFGMALVEAQLCGCATVGVRSGGITDIIDDGKTGYLARPDDASDLARVLGLALANGDRRRLLAAAGRESALARYSSGAIAERFVGWYRELI